MQAFAYFPAIVYRDEHPEWVDYALKVLQKYFDAQPVQGQFCQTPHIGGDPEMQFFIDYLVGAGTEILASQGYSMDKYELLVSGLWGQKVKGTNGTDIHVHKNSQLCGWMFLETPVGGSYPIYYDTRANKQMVELDYVIQDEITNAVSAIHFNNVVPGTILIANSWMQHQLTPNMADSQTKAIHFILSHKERACSTC